MIPIARRFDLCLQCLRRIVAVANALASNLVMDRASAPSRAGITAKVAGAAVLLCTAITVTCTLLPRLPREFSDEFSRKTSGYLLADLAADVCPVVLLCAGILVFVRPRLGYSLGLLSGLMVLPWFILTERSLWEGSWAVLNYVGATPGDRQLAVYAKLRLLSLALIAITITCSCLRLLPSRWSMRKSPLSRRTWPAFAIGLLVLVIWFFHSARPYRVPLIVDAPPAVFRVLHIEKRGLHFRETGALTDRDGRFIRWWEDRRLFQYRFEGHTAGGVLNRAASEQVNSIVSSPALRTLHTPPARLLRSWNAEGWYIVLKDERLLAFTTENRMAPPHEIMDLLQGSGTFPATRRAFPTSFAS